MEMTLIIHCTELNLDSSSLHLITKCYIILKLFCTSIYEVQYEISISSSHGTCPLLSTFHWSDNSQFILVFRSKVRAMTIANHIATWKFVCFFISNSVSLLLFLTLQSWLCLVFFLSKFRSRKQEVPWSLSDILHLPSIYRHLDCSCRRGK